MPKNHVKLPLKIFVDSPGYHIQGSKKGSFLKLEFEKLCENLTKIVIILTHWSVGQAGSNDEKKLKVENLVGLSHYKFKETQNEFCLYMGVGTGKGANLRN